MSRLNEYKKGKREQNPKILSLGWFLFLFIGLFLAHSALSITQQITFQGKLTNSNSSLVTDGTYYLKMTIYDASTGGTCQYTAAGSCGSVTTTPVTTTNGIFSVNLGDTDSSINALPATLFNSDTLYLGLTVCSGPNTGCDSEMTPRKRITSSAFAFNADRLSGLATSTQGGNSTYIPATDTSGNLKISNSLFAATSTSGQLGIGTSTVPSGYKTFIDSTTASDKLLVVRSNSSQTGNLQEWQTNNGQALGYVDTSGYLYIGDGSTSSTLQKNLLRVAYSASDPAGKFNVDSSGRLFTSSSLYSYGNTTSTGILYGLGGIISSASSSFASNLSISGNLTTVNSVPYTWPSSQGGASTYLKNDGSGILTWDTVTSGGTNDWGRFGTTYGAAALMTSTTYPVWFDGAVYASSSLVASGDITLGDASSDVLTINAGITGNLLPSANDTYNLGGYGNAWKDIYASGTLRIGSTSILDTNSLTLGTNSGYDKGKFYVDSSGNVSASGTLGVFGNTTLGDATTDIVSVAGKLGINSSTPSALLSIGGGNILQAASGNPTLKGSYTTGSHNAYRVYVSGKYAYVADHTNGLRIVDISNPAAPLLVGTYDTNSFTVGVFVSGRYAYLAAGADGFLIVDISNPSSPSLIGSYNTSGSAYDVYVSGKYAYVTDYFGSGLMIFDISTPTSPVLVGSGGPADAYRVYVSGRYAYVVDLTSSELKIIDVSRPATPTVVGTYTTTGFAYDVYVSGKYAYVADGDSGLQVINVSNPASPSLTGSYDTAGTAYGVYVSGNYAYLADFINIHVINISNPAAPTLVGSYSNSALGVYVSGKYAYVADGTSGMQIIDINGLETPAMYAGNIQTNDLTITENGDVANNLYVRNGLNVGEGGVFSNGAISSMATTSNNYFAGNTGFGAVSPWAALDVYNKFTVDSLGKVFTSSSLYSFGNTTSTGILYGLGGIISSASSSFASNLNISGNLGTINSVAYTWPSSQGSANTYLKNDGAGSLTWATVSGGSGTNDWGRFGTTYGAAALMTSTTYPVWFDGAVYASSTMIVSGNVTLGDATSTDIISINAKVGINSSTPSEFLSIGGGNILQSASGDPTLKGTLNNSASARGVYVSGKYAYMTNADSGLQIVDISNPAIPVLISSYTTAWAVEVNVMGKYAYVASDNDGLFIIDISNPYAPSLAGSYTASLDASSIYVSGRYAYLADQSLGLLIIDISNPFAPYLKGSYSSITQALAVYVFGKYAYVADGGAGLKIIDVSNPSSPSLVGTYTSGNGALDIYVSGRNAYLTTSASLRIVDISNPASPVLRGSIAATGPNSVFISGKYAYLGDDTAGLRVVDVSSSTAPSLVGINNTPGTVYDVFVSGKYAYVADSGVGLQIIDINGLETPSLYAGNIQTNDITITENGDIANNLYVRNGLNVGLGGIMTDGVLSVNGTSTTNFFAGNVGVGTTTPWSALDIYHKLTVDSSGNVSASGTLGIFGNTTLGDSDAAAGDTTRIYGSLAMGAAPSGNAQLFIQATSTTARPLIIRSSAVDEMQAIRLEDDLGSTALWFNITNRTGAMYIANNNANKQSFFSGLGLAVGIDATHDLGVFNVDIAGSGNISTSGTLQVFSTSSLRSIKLSSLTIAPDVAAGTLYFNSSDGKFYGYTSAGNAVDLGAAGSGTNDWGRFSTTYAATALMTSTTYPVWFDNKVYASSTVKIGGNATAGLSSLTIDAGPADSAATLFQINDNASRSLLSFATSSVYEAAVLTIGIENSPNASGDIILNHGTAGSGALFILGSGNTMSAVQALLGGDSEGGQLTLGSGTVTSTFSASYFRLGETWDSNGEAIDNGKFFINPATGNTSVSGTLHVYGSLTNDILNSNGTVYSNNGVLTNVNPSSLDYKYDVNDLDLDADKILALHIKAFKWKGTDRLDFGLIAEEIKAVAPELYVDDGITKGYRSDHLVFYLLQILQKQQARLDALSSAVNVPLNLDFQQFLTRNDNWYIDENGYFVSRFKTSEGDKEMFGLQSPAAEFVFSSSSQLIDGEAIVNFDPATREIIDPEVLLKVTVTLTSGEAKGIYVSEKNSTGFTAKELGGGRSNATFDWMVVAKRRSGQNEILPDVGTSGGENDIPTNNNVGGEDLVVPDTGSSGTASSTNGNASLTGSPPSAGGTTGENSSDNSTNGTATDGTSTDQTTDNNQTTQNISNTDSNTTNSGGQLTNSDLQQLLNVDGILPSVPESPSPATPEASESSSPTENTPTN